MGQRLARWRRAGTRPGGTKRHGLFLSLALALPCPAPSLLCALPSGSPALHPGSLASAVSLIRALQPLQQGVGAPGSGMAPDKQLEPLFAESVTSKGKVETNHQSLGGGRGRPIICHITTGAPPLCQASTSGSSHSSFKTQCSNVSSPQSLP